MAKLYFKYGAMGSSKSAQALITQFNYEELGMTVWLIKPSVDDRDGANIIRSRIGLQREAQVIHPEEDIIATFARAGHADVIIADEAQFFSPEQIDQLRRIVDEQNIPVLCFGLRTDFLTHFFPGARRLMELADSITEIKTVCACGRKATVNARIDGSGRVITEGAGWIRSAPRKRPGNSPRKAKPREPVHDAQVPGVIFMPYAFTRQTSAPFSASTTSVSPACRSPERMVRAMSVSAWLCR